ncbi:MAG: hypothetical protein ACRD2L_03665 [Terriglobia bacterium]
MPEKENIFEKPKKAAEDDEIVEEPEGFKEGDEHDETPEEVEHKMHVGGKEVDVYTEEGREELLEEDEVSVVEEGFSRGEDEPEVAHCAGCGKVLSQSQKNIEREISHKIFLFCSDACVSKGAQHAKKR